MAHFILYSADKPNGGLELRTQNRDAHIAWLKSATDVKLCTAGPWLDKDGIMRGSLLIVEANSLDTVNAWQKTDPYALAGLSERVDIRPFTWVIGAPA